MDIGLKQEHLTNNEITKSLISMIENNKRNLTYRAATVIAEALNKYYVNLGREITADYLLETEVEQAQRLIRERLEEMRPLIDQPNIAQERQTEESFEMLISFAQEWKLDLLVAELIERRSEYYFNSHKYNEAISNILTIVEYYLSLSDYNKTVRLYFRIAYNFFRLMLYQQALVYYNRALELMDTCTIENAERGKLIAYYNRVLCYYNQKKYDLALKEISLFKIYSTEEDDYHFLILLMEANIYRDLKNYDKAKRIYNKLLKQSSKLTTNTKTLVYENYAELCQLTEDYDGCLNYIKHSHNYPKDELDSSYIPYLYLCEATAHWKLGNHQKSLDLTQKGIELCKKALNVETLLDLHFLLIELFYEQEYYEKIEESLHQLEDYLKLYSINKGLIDIYTYQIEFYSRIGEIEKCKECTAKLRALRKEAV
ncbi:hypothetical protein [Alkaliphilus crotonatoxidans]